MADALVITGLDCFYEDTQILYGLGFSLRQGEVHCLLGRNGAGKTTALKAIMGLVPARAGSIRLDGVELTELPPHEVPKAGVAYVPQGRRLFAEMTVAENIEIGLMARNKGAAVRDIVRADGARLFFGPGTASRLRGRTLDAVTEKTGRVRFVLKTHR